jgi:hypothetical protein
MEPNDKKFIEQVSSSEYFDFILEKQVQKKLVDLYKRYKLPLTAAVALIIACAGILGYKIISISDKINNQLTRADELSLLAEHRFNQSESLRNATEFISAKFQESAANQTEIFEKKEKGLDSTELTMLTNIDADSRLRTDIIARSKQVESKYQQISEQLKTQFKTLDSLQKDLERKSVEIVRNASTVYACVERGGLEGDWDYHPKKIRLPYSNNYIKILFKETYHITNSTNHQKNIIASFKVLVTDSLGNKISESPIDIDELGAREIPKTEHEIGLVYLYSPPNIIGLNWRGVNIIPDFALLRISLINPQSFLGKK